MLGASLLFICLFVLLIVYNYIFHVRDLIIFCNIILFCCYNLNKFMPYRSIDRILIAAVHCINVSQNIFYFKLK